MTLRVSSLISDVTSKDTLYSFGNLSRVVTKVFFCIFVSFSIIFICCHSPSPKHENENN